jgi:hypothetical protein
LPSSAPPPSHLSQLAAVSANLHQNTQRLIPKRPALNLSRITTHSLLTSSHTGTLADWPPPPSLCNLSLTACDLSALIPVSASIPHCCGASTASTRSAWTHVSHLHLNSCICDQIPLALPLFSSATHLHLVNCGIGDSALPSLLPSLPPHLVSIDLSCNPLSSIHLHVLLSSLTALQSLTFIGCRFSPSSSNSTSESVRLHPSLSSVSLQVDGSATAVRLLHAACTRPLMRCIHIEAPYTSASQHVVSFGFPPIPSIESIVICNVPIQTLWLESVLSCVLASAAHVSSASHPVSHPRLAGLRSLRLINNGKSVRSSTTIPFGFLKLSQASPQTLLELSQMS